MKKRAFKIYKAFIDTFTAGMLAVCLFSMLALDSETWIPTIAFIVSLGWLFLYSLAHGWLDFGGDEE